MANLVNPVQGRPVVDITVVASDGTMSPFLRSSEVVFDSGTLVDTVNTWNTWTMRLKAVSHAAYEQRVVPLGLTGDRNVQVRWGIDMGARTLWGPVESHRVMRIIPQLTSSMGSAAGIPFEMTLADALYEFDVLPRIAARRGLVSDIVAQMAATYGLTAVVEPTAGAPLTLVQALQTDYAFIRERLMPAAVNRAGFSGYYLYVTGSELHFHTRDYQKQPLVLPYNTLAAPGASDLIAVDDVQANATEAGGDTRTVAYDPLTGRTAVLRVDAQRYTRFGRRLASATGGTLIGAHVGPNQAVLEQSRTQARYSYARDRYERVSFSLTNVLNVQAGAIIIMQMTDPADSVGGPYHVEGVTLTIIGGTAQLAVTATRGEVGGTRADVGITLDPSGAASPLSPPFEAPGVDPRFVTAPDAEVLGSGAMTPILPGSS